MQRLETRHLRQPPVRGRAASGDTGPWQPPSRAVAAGPLQFGVVTAWTCCNLLNSKPQQGVPSPSGPQRPAAWSLERLLRYPERRTQQAAFCVSSSARPLWDTTLV